MVSLRQSRQAPSALHFEWPEQLQSGQSTQYQLTNGHCSFDPASFPSEHFPLPVPDPSSHQPHLWVIILQVQAVQAVLLAEFTLDHFDSSCTFYDLDNRFYDMPIFETIHNTVQTEMTSRGLHSTHMYLIYHTTCNCVFGYMIRTIEIFHIQKLKLYFYYFDMHQLYLTKLKLNLIQNKNGLMNITEYVAPCSCHSTENYDVISDNSYRGRRGGKQASSWLVDQKCGPISYWSVFPGRHR